MATLKYYIRVSKGSEYATIRVYFSARRGITRYAQTPYVIPVKAWDHEKSTISQKAKYDNTFTFLAAQQIVNNLDEIERRVFAKFNTGSQNFPKKWLQDIIDQYIDEQSRPSVEPLKPETLNEYITRYIQEMESGKRKAIKKTKYGQYEVNYAKGTIKNKTSFQTEFNNFQKLKGKKYDFVDINMDLYHNFVDYFNNKEYSPNTTGKHIKSLKEIMAASREEGLHTNLQTLQKGFKIMSCESDTIYLTHKEIEAIEKLDLSTPKDAELDICRDVFLVGVETLQRYSDYHRIGKENVIILPNKTKAVTLRQQKTNAKVIIPCTPRLSKILAKYHDILPRTYSQMVNDNIKLICLRAKITQKIEHTSIKGAKRITEIVPKYTLVTTHTARRTGATLLYLDGVDILSIMKFTGHETEAEFLKYIRVTAEENAIRFSKMKQFNPPTRKTKKQ